MKKLSLISKLGALVILAVILGSCAKEETREVTQNTNGSLKNVINPALPIYMGQNTLVGEATITLANEVIYVSVDLFPGYTPLEAHLYAGENPPPSSAPGQFPYHWNSGDPTPIVFSVDISSWYECEEFSWYFALHLALSNGETAWILPDPAGFNWLNKKGKRIGWGQYFLYGFESCERQIS